MSVATDYSFKPLTPDNWVYLETGFSEVARHSYNRRSCGITFSHEGSSQFVYSIFGLAMKLVVHVSSIMCMHP